MLCPVCSFRPSRRLIYGSSAALLVGLLSLPTDAAAQDRIDEVTESAAEIQESESFGQPNESSGNRGYAGDDSYYEGDYQPDNRGRQQTFEEDYNAQRYDDPQSRRQGQQGQMQNRQSGDSQGGLGVILRETQGDNVQVADVVRGSPADEAGIRSGDQIVEVNGRSVRTVRELQQQISQQQPGQRIEIVVVRNGRERVVDARLETRREALTRQQQQRGGQQWQQESRVQARLASLERQVQQILNEIRMLRSQVGQTPDTRQARGSELDYPPPPSGPGNDAQNQQNRQNGRFNSESDRQYQDEREF